MSLECFYIFKRMCEHYFNDLKTTGPAVVPFMTYYSDFGGVLTFLSHHNLVLFNGLLTKKTFLIKYVAPNIYRDASNPFGGRIRVLGSYRFPYGYGKQVKIPHKSRG